MGPVRGVAWPEGSAAAAEQELAPLAVGPVVQLARSLA
jgi:hypothetical protein